MNYRIISRLLSLIFFSLGAAFVACLGMSLWMDNVHAGAQDALVGWVVVSGLALGLGLVFRFLGRNAPMRLFRKEALCVIGLGWILASLLGALPYLLILKDCSPAQALFESSSGITTTGASVFGSYEAIPPSLMFWRCLSQWIGGLGVVVFFVAILSSLGVGAKVLFANESSAQSQDIDSGRFQSGVMQILILYLSLSLACVAAYYAAGLSLYESVCHMFTTVATGGFSTRETSLGEFGSPAVEWIAIVFMALGGTSFLVMLRLARGHWRELRHATEVHAFYAILIGVSLVMAVVLMIHDGTGISTALREGTFQTVSILTTTGFSTVDYMLWPTFGHVLLMALMIIGGCSGSTSGGCKVVRLVVAMKVSLAQVEKSFRTHVVRPIKINRRFIQEEDQVGTLVFLVLMALVVFFSMPLVALLEPSMSGLGVLSAVFATLFNIGPGLSEVGPATNFGFMNEATLTVLSLLMVMGRLELFAILVLFSPSLWRRFS